MSKQERGAREAETSSQILDMKVPLSLLSFGIKSEWRERGRGEWKAAGNLVLLQAELSKCQQVEKNSALPLPPFPDLPSVCVQNSAGWQKSKRDPPGV